MSSEAGYQRENAQPANVTPSRGQRILIRLLNATLPALVFVALIAAWWGQGQKHPPLK